MVGAGAVGFSPFGEIRVVSAGAGEYLFYKNIKMS
jgi:hypothetical protein